MMLAARPELVPDAHLCYNDHMDTTIRNLDEALYRRAKARAALQGEPIGHVVNEALRAWLAAPRRGGGTRSLAEWKPVKFPEGSENLSQEIDSTVYGI